MPNRTDHDRRDAQHAARARLAVAFGRYVRRATETAYAHIEEEATRDSTDPVDWSAIGTAAADRALASLATGTSQAIEGVAVAIAPGTDPGGDTEDA